MAQQLQLELPQLRSFCTLSPIPGFAAWLLADPLFSALPPLGKKSPVDLLAARELLVQRCGGELDALQGPSVHETLGPDGQAALRKLGAAYLVSCSATPQGDPVARFHLDNGARLERLNANANLAPKGLRQSFGMMVNYLYDLDLIEANHARFRQGEVARSRAIGKLI